MKRLAARTAALGAGADGALAIGARAIGTLVVRRGHMDVVRIDELSVEDCASKTYYLRAYYACRRMSHEVSGGSLRFEVKPIH